jgi:hypothetical protein
VPLAGRVTRRSGQQSANENGAASTLGAMTSAATTPTVDLQRLADIGHLLLTASDVAQAAIQATVAGTDQAPAPGSRKAVDLATDVFDEVTLPGAIATPWPQESLLTPSHLAVTLTRQASLHVQAMGALLDLGLVVDVLAEAR